MGRSRVLSFMSAFGAPKSPTTTSFSGPQHNQSSNSSSQDVVTSSSPVHAAAPSRDSPPPRAQRERSSSIRPMSMVQTYQPPLMEIAQDTIPELQPIFSFLNSHANKLYQEGYFLKLNDLDTLGRPHADRSWTESFAQLVGTILSLWDASALDVAGQEGEVAPTFINLADASIKMIETLPTRSSDVQPLQNVLSISTAGKNRYLLHFNSLHSLTQWTAAIRLAMYENATLQEAYTGSLIAGKGKLLNNIKVIMDRTKIINEDWTRVRFGAGTPWRRCWCTIVPPNEKDIQKLQKNMRKKSAYDRSVPVPKGTIKFYDTKKTKKAQPIATINDAYCAYAIYPQSKPLIDQSTLIKVEGSITIHSTPETTTEGFVFVMPEVHPAVTGFEMMLRFLFPLYDVFGLYGRPNRLIADTLDPRSLMFALPQERRYGYLEILDVAGLIHETGSHTWNEREWRKKMKDLTSHRMTKMAASGRPRSRASSYRGYRSSVHSTSGVRFQDGASIQSTPSLHRTLQDDIAPMPPAHTASATPEQNGNGPFAPPTQRPPPQHQRSFSDGSPLSTPRHQRSQRDPNAQDYTPSRLSHEQTRPMYEPASHSRPPHEQSNPPPPIYGQPLPSGPQYEHPPAPPAHGIPLGAAGVTPHAQKFMQEVDSPDRRSSSESDRRLGQQGDQTPPDLRQDMRPAPPPDVVVAPPAFAHQPGAQPRKRPGISPDLRRENSRLSVTTLSQLADAGRHATAEGGAAAAGATAAWRSNSQSSRNNQNGQGQGQQPGVWNATSRSRNIADRSQPGEGMALAKARLPTPSGGASRQGSTSSSVPDGESAPYYKDKPLMSEYNLLSPRGSVSHNISPLSQASTPPETSQPEFQAPFKNRPRQNSTSPSKPPNIQKPLPTPDHENRPQVTRSSTSHSITRKPLPSRVSTGPPVESTARSPAQTMTVSSDSLRERYVDEDALAQILSCQNNNSMTSESQRGLRDEQGSMYDNESTASPDYASTAPRKSTETRRSERSIDQPRRGVLKTVGKVEPEPEKPVQVGDYHYQPGQTPASAIQSDLPPIDFGPTQVFNPASATRPHTSGTTTQALHDQPQPLEPYQPSPGRESPVPDRSLTTPEPQLRAASADPENPNRRSVAWQPGAVIGGSPGARQSVTPEQFVQQRAAAGRKVTPIYAHGSRNSASPTPPNASGNSAGERLIPQQRPMTSPNPKRQSSYGNDLPARPQSRTATTFMDHPEDYAAHLSAREQEHVARATGGTLINQTKYANKNAPPPGSGLVGAIEAREREKKDAKQGMNNNAVQQAIAQRQQHYQGAQATKPSYAPRPQQYATPQPQYSMPGAFPPSPGIYNGMPVQQGYGWGFPPQGQQQQQYAQVYQQPQPQYQQPQRAWTPPSGGDIVGGQQQQQQQQQQYPQQWPQQQNPHQQGPFPNQAQQGYYGHHYGNSYGSR